MPKNTFRSLWAAAQQPSARLLDASGARNGLPLARVEGSELGVQGLGFWGLSFRAYLLNPEEAAENQTEEGSRADAGVVFARCRSVSAGLIHALYPNPFSILLFRSSV